MDIEIDQLRQVTNDLLDRLQREGVNRIELTIDYYWDIPADVRYDNPDPPRDLVMGQLSEDLTFVHEILNGSRPAVTYALVWIGSLFRFIGEKIVD